MRNLIIILIALICSLAFTAKNAFTDEDPFEFADIHLAPVFNSGILGPFGGYVGGSGDFSDMPTAMDWSIGNTVPLRPTATDDMVFSTTIGSWVSPLDWRERMRITKDGRVGIGTAGPGARLDIDTDDNENVKALLVRQQDTINNPVAVEIRNDGTGDSLVVDTDEFVVSGNGNVGLGTASPSTPLHIRKFGVTDVEVLRLDSAGGDGGLQGKTYLGLHHWSSGTFPSVRIGVEETDLADFDASMVFQTRNSDSDVVPTTKMVITEDGNVGIGPIAPNGKLHIQGTATAVVNIGGNGDLDKAQLGLFEDSDAGDETGIRLEYDGTNDELNFVEYSVGNKGNDLLTVQRDGNVGIGTSTFGPSAAGVLAIGIGTEPTSQVPGFDATMLYSVDVLGDPEFTQAELFVMDGAGFETQLSPHDPVTGEWIFFSKNVKTGRVIKINMEKLVRKFEEITGEKFIEEWIEK